MNKNVLRKKVKNKFFKNTYEKNWENLEILLDLLDYYKDRIDKTIRYCEESSKTIKSEYFSDVLKIIKGESYEK